MHSVICAGAFQLKITALGFELSCYFVFLECLGVLVLANTEVMAAHASMRVHIDTAMYLRISGKEDVSLPCLTHFRVPMLHTQITHMCI